MLQQITHNSSLNTFLHVIPTCHGQIYGWWFWISCSSWVANKKHRVTNTISSAVLWSLCKLGNNICFQGAEWTCLKAVLPRIVAMCPTRDGKANLGVRHSAINSSYIATADSVEQSEKYIKVGSSGCSTFGLQRCDFGSAWSLMALDCNVVLSLSLELP